jgi:hypothetical protein
MARAREILLDEGYREDEINRMFSAQSQRSLKMEPEWATVRDKDGRKREIVKSLYMKETGLQSEVWKLLKQNDVMKATENDRRDRGKDGHAGQSGGGRRRDGGKDNGDVPRPAPEIKSRMLES